MATQGMAKKVTAEELASHETESDCWISFHGSVYDVTNFISEHPGGKRVLMNVAGRDGTRSFGAVHPKSFLDKLSPDTIKGQLDPSELQGAQKPRSSADVSSGAVAKQTLSLHQVINVNDFEIAAQQTMDKQGYDYYASAACDEITKRENCAAFSRIWLRPRVMVDVEAVDTSCNLLGCPSSFPLFISPAAMAGLAHPDGEPALARAAGRHGIIQVIANMASRDLDEIVAARTGEQVQWFQVYINPDRKKSEQMLERVIATGVKVLCVTVDTNVIGRRERDQRNKVEDKTNVALAQKAGKSTSGGVIGALGNFTDAKLSWKDLAWLRSITKGRVKLVLKGVQTGEDAILAAQHGLDGIIVSNHGGRQLDHARPTLDVLVETMSMLEEAGLRSKMEVYVDGGIRRGTDVYKALALGAAGVGIGRPALFSLTFGQEGVEKCLQILRDEFVNCMQLMGRRNIGEISAKDIAFRPTGSTFSDGWPLPSRL